MVPQQCSVLLAAVQADAFVGESVTYWDSVYGFKMSAMAEDNGQEGEITCLNPECVISTVVAIKTINMATDTRKDADYTSNFILDIKKTGILHGFLGWFDTFFTNDSRVVPSLLLQNTQAGKGQEELKNGEVAFTTGPHGPPTHWKQTLFLLKEFIDVKEGCALKGGFVCRKSKENSRELEVEVMFHIEGKESKTVVQSWVVK